MDNVEDVSNLIDLLSRLFSWAESLPVIMSFGRLQWSEHSTSFQSSLVVDAET
jgi:hypothetical protein